MDPTISMAFQTLVQSNAAEQAHRAGRQSDASAALMQGLSAAVFGVLTQAQTPGNVADLNTASHVPVPQPWVVPNFIQPTGKPVGS